MVEQDSDFGFRPRPRLTVRLEGNLDPSRIGELDRALSPASRLFRLDLTVDISGVTFMDPSVVDWLLCFREKVGRSYGSVRIVPSDSQFVSLLTSTERDSRIEVDLGATESGTRIPSSALPSRRNERRLRSTRVRLF
jgi:anti-anti-sigma regulatory factor